MNSPSGTIAMFWGLLAAIPTGWKSCDGTAGTPDLRNRFIKGAGGAFAVGASGGAAVHNHSFTSDGHNHTQPAGGQLEADSVWNATVDNQVLTGNTDNTTMLPPYIGLIYVQKI